VVWVAADASDPAQIQKVCDEAMKQLGQIDILVNNAGATWGAPAEDYPLEAWDKVMNLNIRSIFLMSQAVGKASMIPRRRAASSTSRPSPASAARLDVKFIAYGTSKGAVVNFTRTLAGEWGAYGITVNALAPGFFPSKMTKGVIA
jgi:NAD(P)-dependent dehydrogenase (short-subunit alcohol dehydrogenase family)